MQSVLDEKLDFSKEEALIISREIKTGGLGIELSESVALSVCSCLESNWTPEILENIERSIEFNRFGLSMSEELSNSILSNLPHEFLSKNHDMLKSKCKSVNEFKENQFELKKDVSKELLKNSLGKYKFDLSTINPDEISKILGCEVEYCFEENGVYSISYLESENLMLVYECDNQSKIDNFSGWLSEEGGLNKACVSKIRVYTVSAEYPQVLDVLDSNHSDFSKLPLYIRVGIQDQGLDVSSFIHENELNFIFGDEGIMSDLFAFYQNDTSKLEILEKMESIMKTCLIKKGESIKISTNDDQDKSIKDNINDVCNQLMDNLKTKCSEYLKDKEDETKLKMAYLFGQFAKKGVLGYEIEGENKANNLFYKLSEQCYGSISSEMKQRLEQSSNYSLGLCIETITDSLAILHKDVKEVWELK